MCRSFLAVLFCGLMISCSSPRSLVYQDTRNFRVSLQQATIGVDLQFYNPNAYELSLKNGDLDAYWNDRYLGKAVIHEQTRVPARDTFLLPVSLKVDLRNILPNALQLLSGPEVLVRLQGSIRVGRNGVFIRVPVRYEGRQQIRL